MVEAPQISKSRVFESHSVEFATAHFYRKKEWSREKNEEVFGVCAREYGHGHGYRLSVLFELSAENLAVEDCLAKLLHQSVQDFDHHHVSFEHPEFKFPDGLVPTTENLALSLMKRLKAQVLRTEFAIHGFKIKGLTLSENDSISAEVGLSPRRLLALTFPNFRKSESLRLQLASGQAHQLKFLETTTSKSWRPTTWRDSIVALATQNQSLAALAAHAATEMVAKNRNSGLIAFLNRSDHFFVAGFDFDLLAEGTDFS